MTMQFPALIVLLLASAVQGEVLSLTEANFAQETAGKTVFIKFFAPWCGHCQALAPTWERLAEDWAGHEVGLVAEVDCTVAESLCEDFQVQGYPTLFYGDPLAPETYAGDLEYEALAEFAKENIAKPICSVHKTEFCSDEEKLVIAELEGLSLTDLTAKMSEIEKAAADEQQVFDEQVQKLQAEYEQAVAAYTAKIEEIQTKNNFKFVKAVVNKKEEEAGSDVRDEF